jgi:hypothetical protein
VNINDSCYILSFTSAVSAYKPKKPKVQTIQFDKMKFSTAAMVLATLAVESVSAVSLGHAHRHVHSKKSITESEVDKRNWTPPPGYDPHWTPPKGYNPYATGPTENPAPAPAEGSPAEVPAVSHGKSGKGSEVVSSIMSEVHSLIGSAKLTVGHAKVMAGKNPTSSNDFAWLGEDGPWTNEMVNKAGCDLTLVLWKKDAGAAMFVQTSQPYLTVKIPAGKSITVSLADGVSGAYTAIYPDTEWATPGFLRNTLGEFTTGKYATFDVSRETSMNGHPMTIETPGCTSTMEDCVFKCTKFDEGDWCGTAGSYELVKGNAATCNMGLHDGQPTGGCQGFSAPGKATTTFL